MKFSIRSLLVLSVIAALVMLMVRTRQLLAVQSAKIQELEKLTSAISPDYFVAAVHEEICDQALEKPPERDSIQAAYERFAELQEARGRLQTQDIDSPQIVRVPMVSDAGVSRARYHVYNPPGNLLVIKGNVLDRKDKVIHKHDFFRPTSFTHVLSGGTFALQIEVQPTMQPSVLFSSLSPSTHTISIDVNQLDEESTFDAFNWSCIYSSKDRPRPTFSDFENQRKLFRTSRLRTRLFYALHMENRRSTDRFQISIVAPEDEGN